MRDAAFSGAVSAKPCKAGDFYKVPLVSNSLRYTTLLKGHLNAGDVDASKAVLETMSQAEPRAGTSYLLLLSPQQSARQEDLLHPTAVRTQTRGRQCFLMRQARIASYACLVLCSAGFTTYLPGHTCGQHASCDFRCFRTRSLAQVKNVSLA